MSRKNKGNRLPPFVPLIWGILNSMAYRDLKHASAKALPFFFGKVKGNHNDPQRYYLSFPFTYREGRRLGFEPATFSTIIRELMKKGFIDPVDKGGLRGDGKGSNLFKLSRRWEKYGTKGFQEIRWECFIPCQK